MVEDESSSNVSISVSRGLEKRVGAWIVVITVLVLFLFLPNNLILTAQISLEKGTLKSYTSTVLLTAYQRLAYPKYSSISGIGNDLWEIFNRDLSRENIVVKPVEDIPYRPLRRIVHDLNYGNIDVFALLAYTRSRASNLTYSTIPVYITSSVFVKRRDFPFTYAGPYSLTGLRVGVVAGSRTGRVLLDILENVKDVAVYQVSDIMSLLRMIKRKRIDLGFYSALSLSYIVEVFYPDLDIVPVSLDRYGHYLVFKKDIDPEVYAYMDHLLFKYVRSGVVDEILKKYDVSPESTFSLNTLYIGIVRDSGDMGEGVIFPQFIAELQRKGINVQISYIIGDEVDSMLQRGCVLSVWDVKSHSSLYFSVDGGIFSCTENIPGICSYVKYVLYGVSDASVK